MVVPEISAEPPEPLDRAHHARSVQSASAADGLKSAAAL